VLEEVIYLLETAGEAPVDLTLTGTGGGVEVDFAMIDASTLAQVGALPKAVSLNELRFSHGHQPLRDRPASGWPPGRSAVRTRAPVRIEKASARTQFPSRW
jgi:hypothetical protein